MRIQPRQQLLEIWQATARASLRNRSWAWGGRNGSNSISDAEQLLCLMTPATQIPSFRLDTPDWTADDALRALRHLGDSVEIPRRMIRILIEYHERYTNDYGTPIFSGGSYFTSDDPDQEPSDKQLALDVVDAFASSVTLSLATIGFVRVFRVHVRRPDLRAEVDQLEQMASRRLTAALIGLLRSFAVNVFDAESEEGLALCRLANQSGLPNRHVIRNLQAALQDVNASLRDVIIGSGQVLELDNPNRLFECGWSWGIVHDAPMVETSDDVGEQPTGVADARPNLYFTVTALDGIRDLFSDRTRVLGLLNEEQLRLAQALQLRWDATQTYWSTIAKFDYARWPLEDMPWRTTDGQESDYFTLLVSSMVVDDLVRRRAPDADLSRVGRVLDELASRTRITRRPFGDDPALALHWPGVRTTLAGSEQLGGPRLAWLLTDFAALLLRRSLRVAGLARETELRGELVALADSVWDHLVQRRHRHGSAVGLWDQPAGAFVGVPELVDGPSWSSTERIIQALVAATEVVSSPPLRSDRLGEFASDLLNEAEHLLDRELLYNTTDAGPSISTMLNTTSSMLRRAREIGRERPGTAVALVVSVLQELDRLAAARQDVEGVS